MTRQAIGCEAAAPGRTPRLWSRRHALGLLAATGLAGHSLLAAEDGEWDLIVVGAGTAGLPAALFAARRGARVLLMERGGQVGGTLWFSGGQMSAAGTRLQKAKGIDDSARQHLDDILRISHGTANRDVVRLAVEEAASTLDWLESAGLQFAPEFPITGTGHEPYSRPRVWGAKDRGVAILQVLLKQLEGAPRNLQLVTGLEAVEPIIGQGGKVIGVVSVDEKGVRRDYRAPAVILASGGYMANPTLFQELNGVPMYRSAGWPMNAGAGIHIGRAAGGLVRGREAYLCDFGSIPAEVEVPSPELARSIHHPERRPPWEVIVNAEGRRFVCEDVPSVDSRERALLAQRDHRYWLVFDDEIVHNSPTLIRSAPPGETRDWTREELKAAFDDTPAFSRAASLPELAAKAGIDAEGLVRTISAYNQGQATGHDALGRRYMPRPVLRPPYYAIRHQGATLISIAGLAVDGQLRVIKPDGRPIEGLHAAGELLGNATLSGRAFCAGMSVTPALTFGRWLGLKVPLSHGQSTV